MVGRFREVRESDVINATIRYSGVSKDLLGISTIYLKNKSFLELSTLFSLTYTSYPQSKQKMLQLLIKEHQYKGFSKYFDKMWGHEHVSSTINKDGSINITISNQMLTLVMFLKDPDAMDVYCELLNYLGSSVMYLIEELDIKNQYPENFV